MAIDTAAKRFSILDFDIPTAPALGPPSSIDAGQRLHLLWLYSGIDAHVITLEPNACRTVSPFGGETVTPFGGETITVRC